MLSSWFLIVIRTAKTLRILILRQNMNKLPMQFCFCKDLQKNYIIVLIMDTDHNLGLWLQFNLIYFFW